MIEDKSVLAIIPARCGSKELPGKNIKMLCGKPLIAWSIEQALASRYIDNVVLSTESEEIAKIAKQSGAHVPFLRPVELATDDSPTIDVLLHAIKWLEHSEGVFFDIIVLLQATSPLREVSDIDKCIEILVRKRVDSVYSVSIPKDNPYFNMLEISGSNQIRIVKNGNYLNRQSAPEVFALNGAVYVLHNDALQKWKKVLLENSEIHIMSKESSIDIDDLTDFKIAEMLMREKIGDA